MLSVYSDDHRLHFGQSELVDGKLQPCFEMPSRADTVLAGGSLFRSYYRQAQLLDAARRMDAPLPAAVRKEPGAYLICRMAENRLGVALCNFSLDEMVRPRIELAGTWGEARFIGCQGRLDGDALTLADIPPYGFAAAILSSP